MLLVAARLLFDQPSEPFYNNDETRHVMTGVFFKDLLHDLPLPNPQGYAVEYYLQYPALGVPLYPPFFYVIEGLAMAVFGTGVVVPKLLVISFLLLACAYLYLLIAQTHGVTRARVGVLVFAFSPLVFLLSGQVMLEIPTVAWSSMALFHFLRYLESSRRLHLVWMLSASVFAALTRFNGVLLVPVFVLILALRNQMRVLARREVILAGMLAVAIVLPFYFLTWRTVGWIHLRQVASGVDSGSLGMLGRLVDYFGELPSQLGYFALGPAVVGFFGLLGRESRSRAAPYLALAGATYVASAPMAIHDSRFVVYWLPAFSLFAAEGIHRLAVWFRLRHMRVLLVAIVVGGTALTSLSRPRPYLRGYEAAARYVLANSRESRFCLFDGGLNGNFIYQVRRNDPARRLWVLRADRILYSVLIQPSMGYAEPLKSDREMIAAIDRYGPEFLVVEEPPTMAFRTPASDRLRSILRNSPQRYQTVSTVEIETNQRDLAGIKLIIYRNLAQEFGGEREVEMLLPALRKTIGTTLSK